MEVVLFAFCRMVAQLHCQIVKLVVVSHFALWCSSLSQGIQSETERCIIIESIYCTNPKAVRRISEESILPGK